MEIKFQGYFDKETFFQAVAIANRPSRRNTTVRIILIFLLISFTCLNAMIFLGNENRTVLDLVIIILAAIALSYITLAPFINSYVTAFQLWRKQSVQSEQVGKITDSGITYFPASFIPWEKYNRIFERQDLLVFLTDAGMLSIFQRRFFQTPDEWTTIREMAKNNLTRL
jgi:hypothetical protein